MLLCLSLSAPCQNSYASLDSSGQSLANNSVPRERLGLELENTRQTGCKLFQLEEQRQSLPWAIASFKPDRLSSSACNPLAWAGKHLHGACRGRRVVLVHPIVAQSPHVCAFARPRDKQLPWGGKLFGCSSPSHLTTSHLGHKVFLRVRRRLSVLVDFLLQPFCYSTSLSLLFWHRAPSPRQASSSSCPSSPLVRLLLGPSSPQAPIRQAVTPSSAASQLRACFRITFQGPMDAPSPGSAQRIPASRRRLLVSCSPFLLHVIALVGLSPRPLSCCESVSSPSPLASQH